MAHASGDHHDGVFRDGLKHGEGSMLYKSGESYKGPWRRDKRHGQGLSISSNGIVYEGLFIDDRMSGHGRGVAEDDDFLFEGDHHHTHSTYCAIAVVDHTIC